GGPFGSRIRTLKLRICPPLASLPICLDLLTELLSLFDLPSNRIDLRRVQPAGLRPSRYHACDAVIGAVTIVLTLPARATRLIALDVALRERPTPHRLRIRQLLSQFNHIGRNRGIGHSRFSLRLLYPQ